FRPCRLFREIPAIGDATGNGEAPLFGSQRKLRRGEDVPHDKLTLEIGVASVALIVRKLELIDRKPARLLHQLESVLEGLRSSGIVQHFQYGTPALHDIHVTTDRLHVVAAFQGEEPCETE